MKIQRTHIGSKIKEVVENKPFNYAEFGRMLKIKRQNLDTKIFSKESLDTNLLAEISEKLDYNFFDYYKNTDLRNENDYTEPINGILSIQIKGKTKNFKFNF